MTKIGRVPEDGEPFTIVTDRGTDKEKSHKIEDAKQMTVVCHQEGIQVDIADKDVREINPEMTVKWSNECPDGLWLAMLKEERFMHFWKIVFPDTDPPKSIANQGTLSQKHVVGLIMLMLRTFSMNLRPFLRLPETYCHPSTQLRLTDLLLAISGGDDEGSSVQAVR